MKRVLLRLAVVAVAAIGIGATAASPASAGVYGYYPDAETCHNVGQQQIAWRYYVCYETPNGWALWAAGW